MNAKANLQDQNPEVPVRHMNFGFGEQTLPKYFYDNNAFASTFFLAFSAVIPQGERFFIDSVRHFRKYITAPELLARVAGFIGQEAMHGKEHDAANAAYTAMGFPVRGIDRATRRALAQFQKHMPPAVQLSLTVALEHYTAIISEYTISRPDVQEKFADGIREFLLWHMMEEIEHKAVAFDVFEQTVGRGLRGYALRAGTMVPVTIGLVGVLFYLQLILLRSDKSQKGFLKHLSGAAQVYGPRGLYAGVLPRLLDYFKPGFHPNHHDTDALLIELRERLLGEHGSIRGRHLRTVRPKRADLTIKALA